MRRLLLCALFVWGCAPHVPFFTTKVSRTLETWPPPSNALCADLNGDGRADIVLTRDRPRGEVIVYLSTGEDFTAPISFIGSGAPRRPTIADLNGDNIPDMAVPELEPGLLTVFLGEGNGRFRSLAPVSIGRSPSTLKAADFNGDGKLDLVLVNTRPGDYIYTEFVQGQLTLLFGHGDGTFDPAITTRFDKAPRGVTTGDFDGDGKVDLAIVDDTPPARLFILRGQGNGSFVPGAEYFLDFGGQGVLTQDVNKDDKPDLIVSHGGVSVMLGRGDGTFTASGHYSIGPGRYSFIADFDGDGAVDIAGPHLILRGDGQGHFQVLGNLPGRPGDYADSSAASGDFNGDGAPDLLITDRLRSGVYIYINTRGGGGKLAFRPQRLRM